MSQALEKDTWQKVRNPYEFSNGVKRYALERAKWRCEECGRTRNEVNYFEIHHKLAIWWAVKNPVIAREIINSVANAEVLCKRCHKERHEIEDDHYYRLMAVSVLSDYLRVTLSSRSSTSS